MFEGIGLFLGALGDALIGPNLFCTGEPLSFVQQDTKRILGGLVCVGACDVWRPIG